VRHVALAGPVNAALQAGLILARLQELAVGPTPDLLVLDATAQPSR
jgi:hypothetical protein